MAHNGKHVWVCRTAQASYWQVGESSEQNGCFKMMLTKYKRKLLQCKELAGVKFAIKKEDITYIVSQAWADSFARDAHNKSAMADCGWNPLNYNCLLHMLKEDL
jgi:hypothetical protein